MGFLSKIAHKLEHHGAEHQGTGASGGHADGFTNWSIYQRNYKPANVPVEKLTHILYAFANISTDDGAVVLSDAWADEQIKYPGDTESGGKELFGNLHQFLRYKREHRHLKLLMSIGGWSYSGNFNCLADPRKRTRFVESAVALVANYGLDGLDIDWEYPASSQEAALYVDLLSDLRGALDQYAQRTAPQDGRFLLTIAAPCSPGKYETLHIDKMDRYLDFWNLMAYDFSGGWDQTANNQANLYGRPFSGDAAVSYYSSRGVRKDKLVLGIPLYGRGFDGTQGAGTPYASVSKGSIEQGVYNYKELPRPGATEHFDQRAAAGSSYNAQERQFITYDTPASADCKTKYIRDRGLFGGMFWELSGDVPVDQERSLVRRIADGLGRLDQSPNHIAFPESVFDNVREGR
ncbi:hypothetical protein MSPP1_000683 [Malassezia sp. CBS 17886]|nr:hypothetical protein MSPP1_000683 [Malassezia sp. CBS 17886]